MAICEGSGFDADTLAAECVSASAGIETILRLHQATADAMQEATWRRWRTRVGGRVPVLPETFLRMLHAVTATALMAITAINTAPVPCDVAPADTGSLGTGSMDTGLPDSGLPGSGGVGVGLDDVSRQTAWLVRAAQKTASAAERVSGHCGAVLEASGMAFVGINTVADASANLAGSVEEVSRELTRTAAASIGASTAADQAATMILDLEQAASQVGSITDIIRRIAAQTNLLALNATIEAARAGDAGRGFAVVASEVKGLARQTADATQTIGRMIGEIRSAVRAVAERVREIQNSTSEVQQMAGIGAAAVEQQRTSITEISEAAQAASVAVGQMHEGIEEVATQSFTLSTAVEDLLSGAEVLSAKTSMLEGAG